MGVYSRPSAPADDTLPTTRRQDETLSASILGDHRATSVEEIPIVTQGGEPALGSVTVGRREFEDLAGAVATAPEGGIVLIRGKVRSRPVRVTGKTLTIRGVPGSHPVIERADEAKGIWDPLLWSDRPLVVEGVELRGSPRDVAPLACVRAATLVLRDCKITMPATGPAIVLRRGRAVRLERCESNVGGQALAVEVAESPCRVTIEDCRVDVRDREGAMLLLWSGEPGTAAAVAVGLSGSHVEAGRVLACRSVAGPISVVARRNSLWVRQARVSYAGYPDPSRRQGISWRDGKVSWTETE